MPADLSDHLVIGISSRALFDMRQANDIFETQGVRAYAEYQAAHADEPLAKGTAFPLIQAILRLHENTQGPRPVEVLVMSRNSCATSLRLFNSINHYGLDIERCCLTGGERLAPYLNAYDVDLFLSAHSADVQEALEAGIASAQIYDAPPSSEPEIEQIRIAFDGDGVLFSDESERIYQQQGLQAFIEHEKRKARETLPEGPFAKLLHALSHLQRNHQFQQPPFRLALVTARAMPAHERVIRTFLAWGVHIDEAHFLGGLAKAPVLEAFGPHLFFDDQRAHTEPASKVVPTAITTAELRDWSRQKPQPQAQST